MTKEELLKENRVREILEAARRVMARYGMQGTTIDRVAEQSGFGSYASLRFHFQRTVGVSPQRYRQSYAAGH